jgi:HSP20 family protein
MIFSSLINPPLDNLKKMEERFIKERSILPSYLNWETQYKNLLNNKKGFEYSFDEQTNEVSLSLEIPGFNKEEINLEYDNGYIYVKAESKSRNSLRKVENSTYVGKNIEVKDFVCKLENGILSISFPKQKELSSKTKLTIE